MEVVQTNTATVAQTSTQQANQATTSEPVISSDFETFLKMLTAQMENQDPLNPVESTDFATQLATFSSVEQQVLTNELLTSLGAQMGALSVSQLAEWVGMEARAVTPVVFDGSPVRVTTEGSHLADKANLVVHNSRGVEVQRAEIDPARSEQDWVGVDKTGIPLPAGTYNLTVESFSNGELIATNPVTVQSRIVEARNDTGQPILVLENGYEVESSDILGLRAP